MTQTTDESDLVSDYSQYQDKGVDDDTCDDSSGSLDVDDEEYQ